MTTTRATGCRTATPNLSAHVARVVADAPPLSPALRAQLGGLLTGGRRRRGGAA